MPGDIKKIWHKHINIKKKIKSTVPQIHVAAYTTPIFHYLWQSVSFPYRTFKSVHVIHIMFLQFWVNLDLRKVPKYDRECFPHFIVLKRGMIKSEVRRLHHFSPYPWRLKRSCCRFFGNWLLWSLNIRIAMSCSLLL